MRRTLASAALLALAALSILWLARTNGARSIPGSGAEASPGLTAGSAEAESRSTGFPASTASPSNTDTWARREEFEGLLRKVRAKLPRAGDLKKLTEEEVHSMPVPVSLAAAALGEVAQAVADHPELAPSAAAFYRECAEGDHLNLIRAFCLARARGNGNDPDWALTLPESVRELSKKAVKF